MNIGDVVAMKSATLQYGGPTARGSVTMKPMQKGHHMFFLNLGSMDPAAPDRDRFERVLRALGWIPGPELQAQIDAEDFASVQEEVKDSKTGESSV